MKAAITIGLIFSQILLYSQDQMYDICPIRNSQEVPSAKVWNTNGTEVDLKEFIGDKPSILVFYRGGWCPYCTRHLSALGQIKDQIDSLGFSLIGITPDDYTNLDSSLVRSENFDYTLFSDKEANAMKTFGINWEIDDELFKKYKEKYNLDLEWWSKSTHHMLPVPSVFIVKEGKIKFQHVDPKYQQRLSPELLIAMLKSTI